MIGYGGQSLVICHWSLVHEILNYACQGGQLRFQDDREPAYCHAEFISASHLCDSNSVSVGIVARDPVPGAG